MMKQFLGNSYLFGANASFIEALYEAYLRDPHSVEPRWRGYFDELQRLDDGPADVSHAEIQERFSKLARERRPAAAVAAVQGQLGDKQFAVLQLIAAYRFQGTRHANVDPLERLEKPYIAELDPGYYGLGEADMESVFNTGTLFAPREMKQRPGGNSPFPQPGDPKGDVRAFYRSMGVEWDPAEIVWDRYKPPQFYQQSQPCQVHPSTVEEGVRKAECFDPAHAFFYG